MCILIDDVGNIVGSGAYSFHEKCIEADISDLTNMCYDIHKKKFVANMVKLKADKYKEIKSAFESTENPGIADGIYSKVLKAQISYSKSDREKTLERIKAFELGSIFNHTYIAMKGEIPCTKDQFKAVYVEMYNYYNTLLNKKRNLYKLIDSAKDEIALANIKW